MIGLHNLFKFFNGVFHRIIAESSGSVLVSATVKMLTCKEIDIEIAFGAKRYTNAVVAFSKKSRKLDSLQRKAIIHEPFRITDSIAIVIQVLLCQEHISGRNISHDLQPL